MKVVCLFTALTFCVVDISYGTANKRSLSDSQNLATPFTSSNKIRLVLQNFIETIGKGNRLFFDFSEFISVDKDNPLQTDGELKLFTKKKKIDAAWINLQNSYIALRDAIPVDFPSADYSSSFNLFIWESLKNAYDAILSNYDASLFSDPPSEDYVGMIGISFELSEKKDELTVTIIDNGAGKLAAPASHKKEWPYSQIYSGGEGDASGMIENLAKKTNAVYRRAQFTKERETITSLRIPLNSFELKDKTEVLNLLVFEPSLPTEVKEVQRKWKSALTHSQLFDENRQIIPNKNQNPDKRIVYHYTSYDFVSWIEEFGFYQEIGRHTFYTKIRSNYTHTLGTFVFAFYPQKDLIEIIERLRISTNSLSSLSKVESVPRQVIHALKKMDSVPAWIALLILSDKENQFGHIPSTMIDWKETVRATAINLILEKEQFGSKLSLAEMNQIIDDIEGRINQIKSYLNAKKEQSGDTVLNYYHSA